MAAGRLVAVLFVGAASKVLAGPSISSCGGAADRLQNVRLSLSPDPIKKGGPFTISVSGNLDGALTGGSIAADIDVKILGIINEKVNTTAPFTLAPGLPGGDSQLVVGPVALPPNVPGSAEVDGTVALVDAAGKPVACIALSMHVPALAAEAAQVQPLEAGAAGSCAKPGDHLRDLSTSTSGGVTKVTGTLDEDVSKASVDVDVTVKALFVSIPIKMTVPVAYSPGFRRGPVSASIGPFKKGPASASVGPATGGAGERAGWPEVTATAQGSVVIKDAADEEIACVEISPDGVEQPSLVV